MKILNIFKHFIFVFIIISCSTYDEERNLPELQTEVPKEQLARTSNERLDVKIKHRGIYVDGFRDNILGNTLEENNLIDWARFHHFNELTLYNVNAVLDNSVNTQLLADFVKRAHERKLTISFTASNEEAIRKITDYQKNTPLASISDGIFTEYEFWNPNQAGVSYTYYQKNILKTLRNVRLKKPNKWKQNLYIYDFVDAGGKYKYNKILNKITRHLKFKKQNNRIVLVNYRINAQNFPADPKSNYYNRIQDLASIAKKKKFVLNVILLFMVRQDVTPSMFPYFADNLENNYFENAFLNYKTQYENSTIKNKKHLNLIGYQLYRYSDARTAKPLIR
ncbi:hypothetical protein [Tenacibaculum sp. 190524A02b]|uniref:hypothetical protein n=1 Tax=Tenacibaculum vairaonense TaxID=3137860 RepID=UPI0031FB0AD2